MASKVGAPQKSVECWAEWHGEWGSVNKCPLHLQTKQKLDGASQVFSDQHCDEHKHEIM